MVYEHRNSNVNILVSRSRDGELIAQVLHRFGFRTVRGSSSRGGGSALLELLDRVKAGQRVAITPDGPRGPLQAVHPGVTALSKRTGVPILPLAWAGSSVKKLSTWDGFRVPLPFGRIEVYFGAPLWIGSDDLDGEEEVRAALNGAQAEAERLLGSEHPVPKEKRP